MKVPKLTLKSQTRAISDEETLLCLSLIVDNNKEFETDFKTIRSLSVRIRQSLHVTVLPAHQLRLISDVHRPFPSHFCNTILSQKLQPKRNLLITLRQWKETKKYVERLQSGYNITSCNRANKGAQDLWQPSKKTYWLKGIVLYDSEGFKHYLFNVSRTIHFRRRR